MAGVKIRTPGHALLGPPPGLGKEERNNTGNLLSVANRQGSKKEKSKTAPKGPPGPTESGAVAV